MMKNDTYLASKPRYEILDGLRGLAAMFVVVYHILLVCNKGTFDHFFNHGHLVVDFFYVLSGFVIGYAYDDRWNRMSTWNFFKRRLIRLHPLLVFGTLFGALTFYLGSSSIFPLMKDTPWYAVIGVMLWCFTMIPLPRSMDIRGWAETNPLNSPVWTLQWEYLANILYALFVRRFSKLLLGICVAVFACFTVCLCLNIDVFGVLKDRVVLSYTVVGGWCSTPSHFMVGAIRMLYPFFCGLFLYRMGWKIKVRGAFWLCALFIIVLFVMPWMGLGMIGENRWTNGLYEAFCILICFPLVVAIGAGSSVQPALKQGQCDTGFDLAEREQARTKVKCGKSETFIKFMGDISFPIYLTHYPFIYMQTAWAFNHKDAPLGTHAFVAVSIFLLIVGFAYAVMKLYDIPIQKWLRMKLFDKTIEK